MPPGVCAMTPAQLCLLRKRQRKAKTALELTERRKAGGIAAARKAFVTATTALLRGILSAERSRPSQRRATAPDLFAVADDIQV